MKKIFKIILCTLITINLSGCGSETDSSEASSAENNTSEEIEVIGTETSDSIADIENDGIEEKLIEIGFSEDEVASNAEILRKCGIPSIASYESPNGDYDLNSVASFVVYTKDDKKFMFTVDNGTIFYVAYGGEDLYDADNGGYLINFDDVHIPEKEIASEDEIKLKEQAENDLDSYFTTTPWYDAWGIAREDDMYMLSCQAQGSVLSSNYITCKVWYQKQDGGSFKLVGVQIGNKNYEIN